MGSDAEHARPSAGARHALAALGVLTAINLLNYADRYLLGGVQELLKRDPSLSGGGRDPAGLLNDASLGTLAAAFFVVYMVASPLTGFLGDRVARKRMIAGGLVLWSAATLFSGLATSFSMLLAARALVGIGEAAYAAASASLIADYFGRGTRGKALGVFYCAIPVGAAIGFAAGGALGAAFGWRTAFLFAGLPGLLLALLVLLIPEPARGAADEPGDQGIPLSPLATLRTLARNPAWLVGTSGMTLMTFSVGGMAGWMPSFLTRFGGLAPGRAGLFFGAITAAAGLLGTLCGAWLGERAVRRHPHGYQIVSGIGLAAAAPALLLVTAHLGPAVTLVASFVALFLATLNTGPLNTALISSVPAAMRASAVSVNIFVIHLLGDAVSPALIGAISDGTGSLAVALACNAIPLAAGGAILLLRPGMSRQAAAPAAPTAG